MTNPLFLGLPGNYLINGHDITIFRYILPPLEQGGNNKEKPLKKHDILSFPSRQSEINSSGIITIICHSRARGNLKWIPDNRWRDFRNDKEEDSAFPRSRDGMTVLSIYYFFKGFKEINPVNYKTYSLFPKSSGNKKSKRMWNRSY